MTDAVSVRMVWLRLLLWVGVAAYIAIATASLVMLGEPTPLIGFTGYPLVGALILSTQPRNGMGWLLYGIGLSMIAGTALNLSGSPAAEALAGSFAWLGWGALPLFALLFPSGRPRTRAGRMLLIACIVLVVLAAAAMLVLDRLTSGRANPFAVPLLQDAAALYIDATVIVPFFVVLVASVVEVAVRWTRSSGSERLQYRWLFFGIGVTVLIMIGTGLGAALVPDSTVLQTAQQFSVVGTNAIPIAIYIAVSRHGLYDIGRVVSRTIAYALVLLTIVAIYAAVVVGVGSLMPADNPLPVAAATLVAAAAFLPVLRVVQRWLDRRFDRARYNAEQVVDRFGERLQTEIDPDVAVPELTGALDRALQPTTIGVWVR